MRPRTAARFHGLKLRFTINLGLAPQALCRRLLRRLSSSVGSPIALRCFTAVLVVFHVLCSQTAFGSVQTIWAVNDGEKIEKDDLNNPNKSANSAWDGRKVKIFGARNEIIAFQLIVEADQAGINRLTVTLPQLKNGKGKITCAAPGSDPTNYAGRPIQIFS